MLASLGGLVSCAAKVHFKEAGNAMNELIANHDFDFRQLVTAAEGQPVTDTFQIARAFGKRHQHVIRAIKCLRCSEEFSTTHFWAVEKINDLGIFDKKQIYYRMDFSGFVMLVMGFNGAKADAVKEAYINAFNWMSAELRKYSESYCVFRSIRSRIGIEVRSAIRIHSINRELNFFYRFLTRFFAAFHYRGIFPQ
ncbi:Rha family transcriptional regulator [Escherichia coli]